MTSFGDKLHSESQHMHRMSSLSPQSKCVLCLYFVLAEPAILQL